jgi:CBS-domain-containing membrane protein
MEREEETLISRLGLDSKIKKRPARYLFQSAVAGAATMAFLMFLHLLEYTGIVAALGATTFMIFSMPHRASCKPRFVIGGYFMGTLAGLICNALFIWETAPLAMEAVFPLGAISVGLASLFMVSTNTEHPPAAGLALGLVIQTWDAMTLIYVLAGVTVLVVIKEALKRYLVDLL